MDSSAVEDAGRLASKQHKATCFTGKGNKDKRNIRSLLQFSSRETLLWESSQPKKETVFYNPTATTKIITTNTIYQEAQLTHCYLEPLNRNWI